MRNRDTRWWLVGLAIAILVVVVLAPLASPDPDGLERALRAVLDVGAEVDERRRPAQVPELQVVVVGREPELVVRRRGRVWDRPEVHASLSVKHIDRASVCSPEVIERRTNHDAVSDERDCRPELGPGGWSRAREGAGWPERLGEGVCERRE